MKNRLTALRAVLMVVLLISFICPLTTATVLIPGTDSTSENIKTPKIEDIHYFVAGGNITIFHKTIGLTSLGKFKGFPISHTGPTLRPNIPHIIIASSDSLSSITPSGDIQVPDQGSQTFTIKSLDGSPAIYVVDKGQPVIGTSYTFTNVTSGHVITAFSM